MGGPILPFEFDTEEYLKEYLDGAAFHQTVWSKVTITPPRRVDWKNGLIACQSLKADAEARADYVQCEGLAVSKEQQDQWSRCH